MSNNSIYNYNGEIIPINKDKLVSRWYGKTIACFGDSRTWYDGKAYIASTKSEWRGKICVGYQQTIAKLLGAILTNHGINGATSVQICDAIRAFDFSQHDAVFLEGGVNDFIQSQSVTVGEIAPIGSTFDTNTVYGAWQSAVEYILNNYPSIQIYVDIPAIAWSSAGVFPYDTAKIKSDVAILYNLPYIDLYKNGGLNELNRGYYYADDVSQTGWHLHFNDYGNAIIGEKIAAFINNA